MIDLRRDLPGDSMKTLLYLALLSAALAASQGTRASESLKLESRFDRKEVEWIRQAGNSSVSGDAFLKLKDGTVKGCAGFGVELLPVATYSNERIFRTYGNNDQGQILLEDNPPKFTPDAPEYHEMVLKSVCNEHGEFVFDNVAPGSYYAIAFIIWDIEGKDGAAKTGGGVMKRIEVKPHSKNRIRLGSQDAPDSVAKGR